MGEIGAMRFTADAGPLKTASSERVVPLHLAVIEADFLTFVATVKTGPLFANAARAGTNTSGAGGREPSEACGRTVLLCLLQLSMMICASRSEGKISPSSNSSRSPPR